MKNKKFIILLVLSIILLYICPLMACENGGTFSLHETEESGGLETNKSPLELSEKEVVFAFIEKVSKLTSYEISAVGTTTTKVLFLDVAQNITSGTIKNGKEYYSYNKTDSTFVHTNFCAFFKDEKVAYDENNTEPKSLTVKTESEYKELFGVLPSDKSLNGFIINDESFISAKKLSENDGDEIITYEIIIDGNRAGANVQKQMKKFGGLKSYPYFKKTRFVLVIKKDWTPVSLTTDFTYDISASFVSNATCNENVTYTYSKINETAQIPNRQIFIDELQK